mgnify:FL=1
MKKNTTKRSLLASVLALVMCVTMLVGTTFAWFTDSASTAVNKIESGTLHVDIVDESGNSLDGKTLSFRDVNKNADILWEPGATFALDSFRIVNTGKLALKYKVIINGVNGNAKLLEAIDFFVKIGDAEKVALADWEGILLPVGKEPIADKEVVGTTDLITISGTMKKEAGNEYQGLSIDGIGITVVATQYTYEYDSKDNLYDKDADATIQVNKDNIQDYLDGKYGSIDGMTLVLAEGNYDRIEFGRATAYAGSNTKYYCDGNESTPAAIKQDIADHTPGGGAGKREYVRSMSNVTLKAADGAAVTINGLVAFGGQVNNTKWYSRDFVADREMPEAPAYDNNISYWIGQKWSNITFEGLTFTGGVDIEAYGNKDTLIDNVKFDNCKFNIANNADATYCIRLNVDGNIAKANNLVVTKCDFANGLTAVLTDGMPNVTVTGSTFSGLKGHAISPMMNYLPSAPGYGNITVTGNTFTNMTPAKGDRVILRMGDVGAGAVFTIQNNTATGCDGLGNSIKVNSLADSGITYNISENNWSLIASDSRLDG